MSLNATKSSIFEENASNDLIPVLIQCFAIIFLGYVTGRCSLISGKGTAALNTFVTCFSLPSLIFSSLVTLNFSNVRWPFLASVFLAKAIVFITVSAVTLVLTRPSNSGIAGLYAIFCTQSNDYALGYPLISSLYRKKTYFAEYIYLLAPIQLLILMPIGFLMMEIHKQRSTRRSTDDENMIEAPASDDVGEENSRTNNHDNPKWLMWSVLKGILTNPVLALTAFGVIANFAFKHNPPETPMMILNTLGNAFPALSLFILGQNMVGKISVISGYGWLEPALLILVKVLVLPLIIRQLVQQLPTGMCPTDRDDFASFGFLYGTFPTAPSVSIFAIQFDLESTIVSTGMVICTMISAPLMLISGAMIALPIADYSQFRATLIDTVFWVGLFGLLYGIWVIVVFVVNRQWKSITRTVTTNLVIFQCLTGIGGMMWRFIDSESDALFYSQYIVAAIGVFSCRIWTAYLAGILAFLQWKSLCFVLSYRIPLLVSGYFVSAIATAALIVGIFFRPPKKYIPDPNFQFGQPEAYVAFTILASTLLFTVICLIAQQRLRSHYKDYNLLAIEDSESETQTSTQQTSSPDEPSTSSTRSIPDLEDMGLLNNITDSCALLCDKNRNCSQRIRKRCNSEVRRYLMEGCRFEEMERQHEFKQHIVLLTFLTISMIVGLAVSIWKIVGEDTTGIFVELEFLDTILNFGQGIFSFLVFGLDWYNFISKPIITLYRKIRFGTAAFILPPREELSDDTLRICNQFYSYHYTSCLAEVVSDKRIGREVVPSAFRGKELVTWLVAIGLAEDRKAAEEYGRQLLLGRVLKHIDIMEDFHDDAKIYNFLPMNNSLFTESSSENIDSNDEVSVSSIEVHKTNNTIPKGPRVFKKKERA